MPKHAIGQAGLRQVGDLHALWFLRTASPAVLGGSQGQLCLDGNAVGWAGQDVDGARAVPHDLADAPPFILDITPGTMTLALAVGDGERAMGASGPGAPTSATMKKRNDRGPMVAMSSSLSTLSMPGLGYGAAPLIVR